MTRANTVWWENVAPALGQRRRRGSNAGATFCRNAQMSSHPNGLFIPRWRTSIDHHFDCHIKTWHHRLALPSQLAMVEQGHDVIVFIWCFPIMSPCYQSELLGCWNCVIFQQTANKQQRQRQKMEEINTHSIYNNCTSSRKWNINMIDVNVLKLK